MFDWLRISETAKSVLWLLRNDRDGFVIGSIVCATVERVLVFGPVMNATDLAFITTSRSRSVPHLKRQTGAAEVAR